MVAFATTEWSWGSSILNESWRDILGLAGLGVTILGFVFTIWQLRKTQSAAKAAEIAAQNAVEESRVAFNKFTVALAHRFVHEAKIHVENEAWEKAAIRLSDLSGQLAHLASTDENWTAIGGELNTWCITCNRLANKDLKKFPKREKWLELCSRLETNLNQLLAPFVEPPGEQK